MVPASSEIKKMVLDYSEVHRSHTIMVKSFHTQSMTGVLWISKSPDL